MEGSLSIIDSTLKETLERRGQELAVGGRRRNNIFAIVLVVLAMSAGFALGLLENYAALFWVAFALFIAFYGAGVVVCLIPIKRAVKALNSGYTERAGVYTAQAVRLSFLLFPVSFVTLGYAVDAKFRLLLAQSRFIEVEALSYLLIAANRKYRRVNWDNRIELFLENYRAIALLGQLRFDEAKGIFARCLEATRKPAFKHVLLNNIAHCELELGQIELAYSTLEKAAAIPQSKSKTSDMISSHVQYNLARCLTALDRLPEAEVAARQALELGASAQSTVYQNGHCYVALGELKMAQGELEEAEQHIRSGLESMRSRLDNNNPAVIKTCRLLAKLLKRIGRTKEASDLEYAADQGEIALEHQIDNDLQLVARSGGDDSLLLMAKQA